MNSNLLEKELMSLSWLSRHWSSTDYQYLLTHSRKPYPLSYECLLSPDSLDSKHFYKVDSYYGLEVGRKVGGNYCVHLRLCQFWDLRQVAKQLRCWASFSLLNVGPQVMTFQSCYHLIFQVSKIFAGKIAVNPWCSFWMPQGMQVLLVLTVRS